MCGVGLGEEGVTLLAGDARRVEEALVLKFDQKWSHWILSGKAADLHIACLLRAEWDDVHDHEWRRLLLLHQAPEPEGRVDHVGRTGSL